MRFQKLVLKLLAPVLLLLFSFPAFATQCLIEPAQMIELASSVSGLLQKVNVQRGDVVKKGQVLGLLDSRAEQAAARLAKFKASQTGPTSLAENKIQFSKQKFNRRSTLAKEKLMANQDSDDAESEFRLAESELKVATENKQIAQLELAQQDVQVDLRTIRSPFNGVVVDQMAFPGELVESSASRKGVFKLAQLDPLKVRVVLPKEAFGKLTPNQNIDIVPEVPAKGRYVAKVKSIDRLIDAASGTFVVVLELANPKLDIPAGVRCKAAIPNL